MRNNRGTSKIIKDMTIKRLVQILAMRFSLNAIAAEPLSSAIDLNLPIHQKKKLHPEISDPVLGDQAQIVEWAWSPQYAERFGLQQQQDGLPNAGLWLVGVKLERKQFQQWQRYTCSIIGLMDKKLPILTPPGERYVDHRHAWLWLSGLPGKLPVPEEIAHQVEQRNFAPTLATWRKTGLTNKFENVDRFSRYIIFISEFTKDLLFFEAEVGCSVFGDPTLLRNEIRFPTKVDGENDDDPKSAAVFESSAVHFDLPDSLIRRIYPYTQDANDWTSCLMRRAGNGSNALSLRALRTNRFGDSCKPVSQKQQ